MRSGTGNFGFDAARDTYVDLVEAGIIDPTKVVRVALENAVSVASVLLLTEATLTEVPEPQKGTRPPSRSASGPLAAARGAARGLRPGDRRITRGAGRMIRAHEVLQVLWFFVPAYLANMSPVLPAARKPPFRDD